MKALFCVFFGLCISLSAHAQWITKDVLPQESVWASSSLTETLGGKEVTYGPDALFDNDRSTPWVEGAEGSGTGEYVIILTQRAVTGFTLTNGFAASSRLYGRNNRVKKLRLSLLAGLTAPGMVTERDYTRYLVKELTLADNVAIMDTSSVQRVPISLSTESQFEFCKSVILQFKDEQSFLFGMITRELGLSPEESTSVGNIMQIMELYGFFAVRLQIEDVYRGSHYDDTCISEITVDTEPFY